MFKIQSMINRYHAFKYERDINKQVKRLNELKDKYEITLKNTDFKSYKPVLEPLSEEDEVRNLYHKFEYEKV